MILLPLLLLAAAAPPPVRTTAPDGDLAAQVIVRSHVVIRVQTVTAAPATPLRSMYREKKGPRCIAMADVAGAAVIAEDSVDLALRTGKRMRARFAASCPALNYYSGFYIAPTRDAKFCAGRDAVRDRAGGECPVLRIKELTPNR